MRVLWLAWHPLKEPHCPHSTLRRAQPLGSGRRREPPPPSDRHASTKCFTRSLVVTGKTASLRVFFLSWPHQLPLGCTLFFMPSAPTLVLLSEQARIHQSRPQFRYFNVGFRRDDHPICTLRYETAKRLRLIARAYLAASRRSLANLRIEKVAWAEREKYVRPRISPTALEVVVSRSVIV